MSDNTSRILKDATEEPTESSVFSRISEDHPTLANFGRNLWNNSSIGAKVNIIKDLPKMIMTPASEPGGNVINDFATEIYNQHKDQLQQAGQHAKAVVNDLRQPNTPISQRVSNANGEASQAIGHGLAGAIPIIGPAAAHAGEKIGSGDVAGGAGAAIGLIGSTLVGGEMTDKFLKRGAKVGSEVLNDEPIPTPKTETPLPKIESTGQHIDNPWDSRNPINQVKKLPKEATTPTAEESAAVQARMDKVTPKPGQALHVTEETKAPVEAKPVETPPDPEEVKKVIQRYIDQKGLVNKGHMGIPGMPDENLTMFEHPDHPGLTATLRDREINSPDTLINKMNSKLKEFGVKNPRDTASHIVEDEGGKGKVLQMKPALFTPAAIEQEAKLFGLDPKEATWAQTIEDRAGKGEKIRDVDEARYQKYQQARMDAIQKRYGHLQYNPTTEQIETVGPKLVKSGKPTTSTTPSTPKASGEGIHLVGKNSEPSPEKLYSSPISERPPAKLSHTESVQEVLRLTKKEKLTPAEEVRLEQVRGRIRDATKEHIGLNQAYGKASESAPKGALKDLFSKDDAKSMAAAGRLGDMLDSAHFYGKAAGDISQYAAVVHSSYKGAKKHSEEKKKQKADKNDKMVDNSTRG